MSTASFYGEAVTILVPITCWGIDLQTGYPLTSDPLKIPANTPGIFIERLYRPVFGMVNLIRVNTNQFRGWCYLHDNEIEVNQ